MNNLIIDVECNPNQKTNCAVMLGYVSCDGYREMKKIGVFSHFHQDHIHAITECITTYDILLTHSITFDAITVLNPGMKYRSQWIPQQFDTEYHTDDVKIRLLKANHIPGSSQVYVESDGKSMLYSGDFSYPDMQIKKADYLVLDATHGDPSYDGKTDRHSVMNRLFDDVKEKTDYGKTVVIHTSGGTLQEIVRHFEISQKNKIAENVSFVMDKKQEKILAKIYKNDIESFRTIIYYDTHEFWKLIREDKPCIIFTTSTKLDYDLETYYKVIIGQHRFGSEEAAIIPFSTGSGCRYNLASHSSIMDIYSYIEAISPKFVVTDSSRSSYARILAKLIEQKFPNIKATSRPT